MGGSRTVLPPGKGGIHMKRICCPFITLLMALSLLSACQPTPEVEPVAQKDSDALIERVEVAEEGVADMAEAPESRHITRELTEVSQKTGIDITIDADVVLPETDAIPVAHVQSGELDMQVMENIWEIVANGSGMLEDFPRSYYEGQASMWMEYREAGNLDKYSSFEEMDAAISELLAEAATKRCHFRTARGGGDQACRACLFPGEPDGRDADGRKAPRYEHVPVFHRQCHFLLRPGDGI